jgi:dephospho-CoA kinase
VCAAKQQRILRVGITGGIGSGKSTLCNFFKERGRTVISADDIARDLTEHNDLIRKRIQRVFGPQIYRADASLDRKLLASIVFGNAAARKRLNSIVHPPVVREIEEKAAALTSPAKYPYLIVEAALIYETGLESRLDYTIVVDAPEEVRISRIMLRDGCTRNDVLSRIQAQMPMEQKLKRADIVLLNDGNVSDLKAKVPFLDTLLSQIAGRRNLS